MSPQSKARRRSASLSVAIWLAAVPLAYSGTTAELQNFTAQQASTLLSIARDLFPQPGLNEADFQRCLAGVDAAVTEEERAAIAEAMSVVDGALRRMGYRAYEDISDEYERVRMAKMLAEGRWMRGYRKSMEQCLNRQ
jgi:hypothetical protein